MLKVGIIGAGTIAGRHLESFLQNKDAKVVAIADLNEELAKNRAEQYGIEECYNDYKKILEDKTIEAVLITTPTFTHHDIVIDALRAGKHVMCEKPPCLTPKQAEECVAEAEKCGKLLMWAFVCRFVPQYKFIKDYIASGRLGEAYHAEVVSVGRCSMMNGWFLDKNLAGGHLLDVAIHRIDEIMYLMDYPKVKYVVGYSTDVNKELPSKIKGLGSSYTSRDAKKYERTVESAASGYVKLDNGVSLFVKAGSVMYSVKNGAHIELIGDKSGVYYEYGKTPEIVTSMDDYMYELKPEITDKGNPFEAEVNHFVDCVLNGTECIVKPWQAVEVLKIINGIYRSGETGEPVIY